MNCGKCGAEIHDGVNFCPNCGESSETIEEKKQGMLWYKFTAYFIMPVYAFFSAVTGVLLLPNVLYNLIVTIPNLEIRLHIESMFRFLYYDSFEVPTTIYALAMFAFAVYYVYIAFSLIKFKKDAPKHVYISIISSQIIGLIYFAMMLILLRSSIEFDAESITGLIEEVVSTVITTALWMLVYTKYFNKRKHLFVN